MYYVFMAEKFIRANWEWLLLDIDNPRPDIKDPEEWIALAKAGMLKINGCKVVIQNQIAPAFKPTSPSTLGKGKNR